MQFQNAILTEEGVRILQSGASNNPVVFTRFLFTGSPTPLTAQTVNLPEPTWGNGHVTNYAAGENGFVLYMMATNDTDYGYAYGFGVYGYLQNEGVENEKLLIVANYAGNVTYVSEASGSYTRFHLAITVSLSMTNSVLAIAPRYDDLVSNTAFQDLLERTVTTHSAADPQVGDDQRVLGDKTFFGQTKFGQTQNAPELTLDNDENEFNERQPCGRLRAYNGREYGAAIELTMASPSTPIVYTNGNVLPMTSGHQLLGNQNYKWASITVGSADVDHLYVNSQNYQLAMYGSTIELCDEQSEPYAVLDVESGHLVISDERDGAVTITPALTVAGNLTVTGSFSISSMNAGSINANSATIGNISTTTLTTQGLYATGVETGGAIVSGSVKTGGLVLRGVLDTENFPIISTVTNDQDVTVWNVPIGSIRLVAIRGLTRGIYMPYGARLARLTLVDQEVSRDETTGQIKFTDSHIQLGTSGANYALLNCIKHDADEMSPIALVMKVRNDEPN